MMDEAEPVAAVPGVLWKVRIMNEAKNEAGGIYLFADGDTLQNYLNGEIVAGIVSHPARLIEIEWFRYLKSNVILGKEYVQN